MAATNCDAPPFPRGTSFALVSSGAPTHPWEGMEWLFDDEDLSTPNIRKLRTNRKVRCRVVRNKATVAILPKRLVVFKNVVGSFGAHVDGYATGGPAAESGLQRSYPSDEWLPTAGAAVDDLFWIVVEGPAVVTQALSNLGADVAAGDRICAFTSQYSTDTTGGRAQNITSLNAAATTLFKLLEGYVGYAMSTSLTNSTGGNILIEVGKW